MKSEMQIVKIDPLLFDYSGLDADVGKVVQQHTERIRTLIKRTARDIITIGLLLIETKDILGHGQFGDWLNTEFSWSVKTATRFMNVAQRFKFDNLSNLNFDTSALYVLAAPSTPETARQEALERAQTGEVITHRLAAEIIARCKLLQTDLPARTKEMLMSHLLAHGIENATEQLVTIARIQDPSRKERVIELMIGDNSPSSAHAAIRQVRIEKGELTSNGPDIIKPSNWWAFGRPYYRQEDGFSGSIPGEVYANALYYFAPSEGIAIDGMAGSGMLRRVYEDRSRWQKERHFNLDIYLFDQYPREPFAHTYDIRTHDLINPLPAKADWLFVDPPYFAICQHLYQGELAQTTDYRQYRELMSKMIRSAYQSLNSRGVFCLYVTPFSDINNLDRPTIDVPLDMLELAKDAGFTITSRVYVNRGEQQRRGGGLVNIKAKTQRRMISDACELLVFRKEEAR